MPTGHVSLVPIGDRAEARSGGWSDSSSGPARYDDAVPELLVVACAAGGVDDLAARLVRPAVEQGWNVQLVPTVNAEAWLAQTGRLPELNELTTEPVSASSNYRRDPAAPPTALPDAAVVVPATFGTINKVAAGVADNRATTKLCELLGARPARRIVFVPNVNAAHVRHPAWEHSVATVRAVAGVTILDDPNHHPAEPGSSPELLPWTRLLTMVTELVKPSTC